MAHVRSEEILHAALGYAARGWPVLPLHHTVTIGTKSGAGRARCSCGSARCESQAKHPRTPHGLRDASTELDVISAWWRRWPMANVGLVTGVNFDVLDVDGLDALDRLDSDAGITGPMALTGRGVHWLVEATGAGNRAGILPGIDWRGRGGYIVAPPSRHASGRCYTWMEGFSADVPLPPCPAWLRAFVERAPARRAPSMPTGQLARPTSGGRPSGASRPRLDGMCAHVARAPEGTRNHALNWAAFTLRPMIEDGVLDRAEVEAGLQGAAARCGLGEVEAEATIRSGLGLGAHRAPVA